MSLTTWRENHNLLLNWVERLSNAIQNSEEELRNSIIAINNELVEVKKSKVPIVVSMLKKVEYTVVSIGIVAGIFQNIIHGLDGKLTICLASVCYLWGVGKYNRSVLEQRVEKLEQLKCLQPTIIFRRFENLLRLIESSKRGETGYQSEKNFWLRTLRHITEEGFSDSISSGSDDSSRGDVDSPLPISSGGSD